MTVISQTFHNFERKSLMKANLWILLGTLLLVSGCLKDNSSFVPDSTPLINQSTSSGTIKVSKNLVGDPADVTTVTTGGLCLMGGSTDVDGAFKWMITSQEEVIS